MAPVLAMLAQSESKIRFMERLGLSMHIPEHKTVYGLMKTEAIQGREIMLTDRNVLLPHLRDDISVQPPYSSSQITDLAMRTAVCRIYRCASPETKSYYDRAHDIAGIDDVTGEPSEENWIIRWMLWHVFRYRDSRNKHRSPSDASTNASAATDFSAEANASTRSGTYGGAPGFRAAAFPSAHTSPEVPQATLSNTRPQGRLPYDPTRDS